MRPLTEEETKIFFEKLSKYIGDNIKHLIDRSDGTYCFRLHRERVYYVSERIMKQVKIFLTKTKHYFKFVYIYQSIFVQACHVGREHLVSLGTCFGKFTKSKKFRLHITALDFLAPYASHKVWLKNNAEQQFLYGHNATKAGLGRDFDFTKSFINFQ